MTSGEQFLHQQNPNLHHSQEVEGVAGYLRANRESIPNDPAQKIEAYLGFLAHSEYANDGILTGDQDSIDRQIVSHVIKSENVPEGYFELQRRIAREQGHGDIRITSDMRRQLIEAIQTDQRSGLAKWVEYLGGDDGGYPDWFKQYTWNAVTKLGTYDKEKQEFQKRSKGTTAAYPELNREALAYVYDKLNQHRVQGRTLEMGEERLGALLNTANFGKLYAHAALEVTPDSPELRNETKGSWTKFNQTADPRTARRLSGSLQAHGTGWCTAGESTAAMQLQGGDFYVYYTRDEDSKDTVPRVAIRMQDGEVAEVRGVNAAQELEPVMADITSEQLKDLPGGKAYIKKADDMKRLTAIEQLISKDQDVQLTSSELRFLYELDHDIQGFGYERDPRIDEIKASRDERDKPELARILPETVHEQLDRAVAAYQTVAEHLGAPYVSTEHLQDIFAAKTAEWAQNGTYDYLVEQFIASGSRPNLVLTPNVYANMGQIVDLAKVFGQQQPYETYVYDAMYAEGNYTDAEWSGYDGSNEEPIRFSLIGSKYDAELGTQPAADQKQQLQAMQTRSPGLNLRVPSVLDAVSLWYSLRAKGEVFDNFDKTYIRHFDMEPKRLDGFLRVPSSGVDDGGRPSLDFGDAGYGLAARLAVG